VKSILVLIPTYNERDNVASLAREIFDQVPNTEILFIDDHSPDGTGEILDKLHSENERIHVIHRPEKLGLGSAYLEGFAWSVQHAFSYSICMDADFSHDPAALPVLIEKLTSSHLVAGSRYLKTGGIQNWSLHRRILSRGAALYVRLITRLPLTDPTGGYNGYQNEMLKALPLHDISSNGYSFQIEMKHLAWRQGYTVEEFPITFTERRTGKSKMSAGIIR
jgi:dolichol-phosphate mannosyltransferase